MSTKNVYGEGDKVAPYKDGYRVRVSFGYSPNGKRVRKAAYGKTKKEALAKAKKLRLEHEEGKGTDDSLTVATWLETWLSEQEKRVSERTIFNYRTYCKYLTERIGDVKLVTLSPLMVSEAQQAIFTEVGSHAAHKALIQLKSALRQAVDYGLINTNPAKPVRSLGHQSKKKEVWTAEEVTQFVEHARGKRYYAVFYLALTTGLRPGELIALYPHDIEDGLLHVRRNVINTNGKVRLQRRVKTEASLRIVPVPSDALEVISEHRELYPPQNELLFSASNGSLVCQNNLGRSLAAYAKAAGVTPLTPHYLRHTFASMCIADGMDVVELAKILGHADPSFTLKRYAHFFEKRNRPETKTLKERLG